MIGYKVAKADNKRVIVTLEIPEDALTNIKRKDIVDINTAKHRTNKAKVLSIEDEDGKNYSEAVSFNYDKKSLTYKINETILIDDYDNNIETVCGSGIHFFLTKRCAELYGLEKIENGLYQSWYDNGQKSIECSYVNGNIEGLYQTWHENGQKWLECTYVNGNIEGLYQTWHENGKKWKECTFANNKIEGYYQQWYENGQIYKECTYVNGNLEGLLQSWYSNGQKWEECTYVNGQQVYSNIM